jgi:putative transposase
MGAGAALLLQPQGMTPRPSEGKRVYYAGWSSSIAVRTSHPKRFLAILSSSRFRKRLLDSA